LQNLGFQIAASIRGCGDFVCEGGYATRRQSDFEMRATVKSGVSADTHALAAGFAIDFAAAA
jgi:hypothetical protein